MAARARVPTRRIKREIRTLRRTIASEKRKRARATKTVVKRTASLGREMESLKAELEKLARKKTPKKQLSEYNLFMRRQLRQGKTFKAAVKLWKAYIRGAVRPRIVRQVRIIRRAAPRTRVITRTIVRRVPITRTVVKRVPVTRTVVRTVREPSRKLGSGPELEGIISRMVQSEVSAKPSPSFTQHLSDEEVSIRLVNIFFHEVHRLGLKRRLELDDVIIAYQRTLERVKGRKAVERPSVHVQVAQVPQTTNNPAGQQVTQPLQ